MGMPFDFINWLEDKKLTCIGKSSIKQHQTNKIYKGILEDLIFIKIQESMIVRMIATYIRSI
jgi:hypothetical protein